METGYPRVLSITNEQPYDGKSAQLGSHEVITKDVHMHNALQIRSFNLIRISSCVFVTYLNYFRRMNSKGHRYIKNSRSPLIVCLLLCGTVLRSDQKFTFVFFNSKDKSDNDIKYYYLLCTTCHHISSDMEPRNQKTPFPGIQYSLTFCLSRCQLCRACPFYL